MCLLKSLQKKTVKSIKIAFICKILTPVKQTHRAKNSHYKENVDSVKREMIIAE